MAGTKEKRSARKRADGHVVAGGEEEPAEESARAEQLPDEALEGAAEREEPHQRVDDGVGRRDGEEGRGHGAADSTGGRGERPRRPRREPRRRGAPVRSRASPGQGPYHPPSPPSGAPHDVRRPFPPPRPPPPGARPRRPPRGERARAGRRRAGRGRARREDARGDRPRHRGAAPGGVEDPRARVEARSPLRPPDARPAEEAARGDDQGGLQARRVRAGQEDPPATRPDHGRRGPARDVEALPRAGDRRVLRPEEEAALHHRRALGRGAAPHDAPRADPRPRGPVLRPREDPEGRREGLRPRVRDEVHDRGLGRARAQALRAGAPRDRGPLAQGPGEGAERRRAREDPEGDAGLPLRAVPPPLPDGPRARDALRRLRLPGRHREDVRRRWPGLPGAVRAPREVRHGEPRPSPGFRVPRQARRGRGPRLEGPRGPADGRARLPAVDEPLARQEPGPALDRRRAERTDVGEGRRRGRRGLGRHADAGPREGRGADADSRSRAPGTPTRTPPRRRTRSRPRCARSSATTSARDRGATRTTRRVAASTSPTAMARAASR